MKHPQNHTNAQILHKNTFLLLLSVFPNTVEKLLSDTKAPGATVLFTGETSPFPKIFENYKHYLFP